MMELLPARMVVRPPPLCWMETWPRTTLAPSGPARASGAVSPKTEPATRAMSPARRGRAATNGPVLPIFSPPAVLPLFRSQCAPAGGRQQPEGSIDQRQHELKLGMTGINDTCARGVVQFLQCEAKIAPQVESSGNRQFGPHPSPDQGRIDLERLPIGLHDSRGVDEGFENQIPVGRTERVLRLPPEGLAEHRPGLNFGLEGAGDV